MISARGFSLIEALVSMTLFMLAIPGIAGLQGTLLGFSQNSQFRQEAAYFVEQIVGFATADPTNANCYAFAETCTNADARASANAWLAQVQQSLPGSTEVAPQVSYDGASGSFSATVFWRRPSDDTTQNFSVLTVVR